MHDDEHCAASGSVQAARQVGAELGDAFLLEAKLLGSLVFPGGCGCRVRVTATHPLRPWFLTNLECPHRAKQSYAWLTPDGECVPEESLREAFDEALHMVDGGLLSLRAGKKEFYLRSVEGDEIGRYGDVYVVRVGGYDYIGASGELWIGGNSRWQQDY